MKRVFGLFEAAFDALYLIVAFGIGFFLLFAEARSPVRLLAGVAALVLGIGDLFHLVPRMAVIVARREEIFRSHLGRGKQIASITMTVFYLLLWQILRYVVRSDGYEFWDFAIYFLAMVRIALCLLPQNRWRDRYPPVAWGVWRNIPFFMLGIAVAWRFYLVRNAVPALRPMWLAIVLSFACYLPVVLWSNRNPKIGMLMFPKTCAYLWMLAMFLFL
ncbi:hypothetical protein LJC31_02025 [Synergistaceae bacterium OttesenSCG-928-I11]|nr:hypothetical protein [Synergistaceae bacterium OttesenSCG-928-I11]